jgi:uncharacterized protein (TIGR04255 family)
VRFRPHQDQNAIVLASFACEFSPPLDHATLKSIGELHAKFATLLPQKIEQPALTFRLVPGAKVPQTGQTIGAIAFSSYERDGSMARQFNATPVLFTFAELKYSGWEKVWPEAKSVLEAALDMAGNATLTAFGLEYQDRFLAEGDLSEPIDVSAVLARESKYLAPRVFEFDDIWHLHEGSVSSCAAPLACTCNENVNVGLVRRREAAIPQLAIEITLQHRRALSAPMRAAEAVKAMGSFFDDMHACDKAAMIALLTSDMATRIGLGKNAQ